jgi:hypothetical protein
MSGACRNARGRRGLLLISWLAGALPALGAATPAAGSGAWTVATLAPGAPAVINAERGIAVARDGSLAAVGARFDGPSGGGAVYLFAWDGSDWDEILTLTSDQVGEQLGISLEQFGISLALHGNVLAVGAAGKQRNQGLPEGAVVLFTLVFESGESGNRPAARIERVPRIASLPAGVRSLGRGIALDDHWLAVSATVSVADGDFGLVLAYPLPYVPGSTGDVVLPAGLPGDRFGESLALSGGNLIVGAPGHQGTAGQPSAGAVYRFRFATVDGWQQLSRLQAADEQADAQFGSAVAGNGATIVVGAPGAVGAVGGVRSSGAAGAAAVHAGSGAVYVFTLDLDHNTWTQQAKLAPASAAVGGRLGQAVAIDGDLLIAGAPLDAASGPGTGAAYVFQRTGNTWAEPTRIVAEGVPAHALFGFAVAQSGSSFLVGAPLAEDRAGAAYVFSLADTPGGLKLSSARNSPRASKSGSRRRPATMTGRGAVLP